VARGSADNGPYRDGQGSLYEGAVRIPAFIRWPRGLDAGVSSALIHVTDLYPTLLARAGGNLDQRKPLDGIDQWPAIREGKLGARREVPIAVEDLRAAIRVGDWKLILYAALPARVELYDIPHDPGEEDNAAERNPQLVQDLTRRLTDLAWEMAPARHLEDLARMRRHDLPMVWGANPLRHGATAEPPRFDPAELAALFPADPRQIYDVEQVIARLVAEPQDSEQLHQLILFFRDHFAFHDSHLIC
jgi:hypothetical protein